MPNCKSFLATEAERKHARRSSSLVVVVCFLPVRAKNLSAPRYSTTDQVTEPRRKAPPLSHFNHRHHHNHHSDDDAGDTDGEYSSKMNLKAPLGRTRWFHLIGFVWRFSPPVITALVPAFKDGSCWLCKASEVISGEFPIFRALSC